ncbi:LacI family transcriptional regulator [Kribbella aluminosa]|uniref:LacI family transcriptional regulator n=1 Tax=Kribbella aluminosa TaxID=416017 RepID=A0ABS4UII0_9ACTN|nr:LacI family DNA-binding transcriptional regulator [Kribbella aluminosa]MBP2351472.1 LacI family transcriptional regulator [Kribbella aluminosa]
MTDVGAPRITIHEVARRAGVSHQTVSRYFRRIESLKPATRQKIEAVVSELNYRPNPVARSMRTKRSGRLATILPSTPSLLHSQLLGGAAAIAQAEGYLLEVVTIVGDARTRADRVLELAANGGFEGILSLSPLALDLERSPVPIVATGDYDDQFRSQGELADASVVRNIIEHLVSLGHRDFLHIAGPQTFTSARNRKLVYETTIEELGLRSYGVADGDWSGQSGYDAVQGLPATCGVTAVIAASDQAAMGAIRAALERGWRVPDDISVFGWDDYDMGRYATPALSTVAVDRDAQGREAILKLIATVRGEEPPEPSHDPINRIIIRESVAPAPRRGAQDTSS